MRLTEEFAGLLREELKEVLGKEYTVEVNEGYDIENDLTRMSVAAQKGEQREGCTLQGSYKIFTEAELVEAIVRYIRRSFGIEEKGETETANPSKSTEGGSDGTPEEVEKDKAKRKQSSIKVYAKKTGKGA